MKKTFREEVIDDIFKFSEEMNSFELIEKKYQSLLDKKTIIKELIQVGIMPEVFDHDSSEEKLWSKFSDVVLAKSLDLIGLQSEVLRTRGNSADVYSRAKGYTLVSDAKCFRLSRTAKNQKDFKVKALDDWRREDTYALLVSPLSQYPADKSQIYPQAFSQNVTLLSYVHLQFMIEKGVVVSLEKLWKLPEYIAKNYKKEDQKRGVTYWHAIDAVVCEATGQTPDVLKLYKQQEIDKTKEVGEEGISYWTAKINEFKKLSREQAIKLLIKSQKIEQKIETIKKAIEKIFVI
ncbi:MAG: HindIII family type II restriction endonuclease [Candidatus Magasanikbacteria bacterium]|nr:HindIII family type II restriction endonuclease [Candidatus Magasanikbacteria bacterium]